MDSGGGRDDIPDDQILRASLDLSIAKEENGRKDSSDGQGTPTPDVRGVQQRPSEKRSDQTTIEISRLSQSWWLSVHWDHSPDCTQSIVAPGDIVARWAVRELPGAPVHQPDIVCGYW